MKKPPGGGPLGVCFGPGNPSEFWHFLIAYSDRCRCHRHIHVNGCFRVADISAFDPLLTDDVFMSYGSLLIVDRPFTVAFRPAAARPKLTVTAATQDVRLRLI